MIWRNAGQVRIQASIKAGSHGSLHWDETFADKLDQFKISAFREGIPSSTPAESRQPQIAETEKRRAPGGQRGL